MSSPKVLVLRAPGINCERETHFAFARAGGTPEFVHIQQLLAEPKRLDQFRMLVVPGGFSYGDDISSGRVLAQEMKAQLGDRILQFVARGGLVLGICNGFQVLLEAGLLEGAMLRNARLKFNCEHVHLRVEQTTTPFTARCAPGSVLRIPVAHGEGNYFADPVTLQRLEANGQVIFRYCTAAGEIADAANPNGSLHNIAGICNATRNVVGLMPHPERACETALGSADGLVMFESAIDYVTAGARA